MIVVLDSCFIEKCSKKDEKALKLFGQFSRKNAKFKTSRFTLFEISRKKLLGDSSSLIVDSLKEFNIEVVSFNCDDDFLKAGDFCNEQKKLTHWHDALSFYPCLNHPEAIFLTSDSKFLKQIMRDGCTYNFNYKGKYKIRLCK